MPGVLGRALELAVLALIMGLIQREMVAHSWTMITIDAVEHSRAAHAGGQGWSASGSSAGQPDGADGPRPSWTRPLRKPNALLGANASWASRAGSGAISSSADAGGHRLKLQAGAVQIYGPARPRPSWAPPSANPLALLDANEERHLRDGSDADGGGAGGSDAGSSGASGRGAVGSGAVRNGVAGSNAFGNGNYGSADRSNTQGGTDFDERLITPRLAATALTGAQLISIGLTAGAAGLTVAGLTVTWLAAAGLTAAGLLAAWRSRRHLESSKRATRERQGSGGIASELVAAELTAAWSAASGMAATESTGLTAAAGLVAAGTLATWLAVAGMETIGLTAAWLEAAGLTAVWYGRQYIEGSHGLRAAANAVILDDSTAQRRQPLAAQRKGRLAARKQRRLAK